MGVEAAVAGAGTSGPTLGCAAAAAPPTPSVAAVPANTAQPVPTPPPGMISLLIVSLLSESFGPAKPSSNGSVMVRSMTRDVSV